MSQIIFELACISKIEVRIFEVLLYINMISACVSIFLEKKCPVETPLCRKELVTLNAAVLLILETAAKREADINK